MSKAFPFVKQPDAMDCGVSCLKMIAAFYKRNYKIDTLREFASASVDGVSLLGVSKAAEQIGFKTMGGLISIQSLISKGVLPCVLHWEQNHFVVLYKIKSTNKGDVFYIADPGKGLLTYRKDEFIKCWESTKRNDDELGVALFMEPTETFFTKEGEAKNNNRGKMTFLYDYFKKYKKYFLQISLGLIIGSIIQLLFPFFTQSIVDIGIGDKDISFIWIILLAQFALLIGQFGIDFIRRRILLHISTRINISLISDFFIKLMKLPMRFFDTKLLGDLLQRIEDHRRVQDFLTVQTLNVVFSICSLIVFGAILTIYNVQIFMVFLCGSIVYAIWILFFLKKRRILDYQLFEQAAKERNATYQLITAMQEIKLQNYEVLKRWEWEDIQADKFDINLQTLSLSQTQEAGSVLINESKNIIITAMTAISVINGDMSLGMMLAVQFIIGQLNNPIVQLMSFIYSWQDVSISLERMNEIHSKKEEENTSRTISSLDKERKNNIVIENLTFRYDEYGKSNVLNNISLCIPEGKTTAIVGASGSGKTTLIKLLLGYYEPREGTIKIGGLNLSNFNLSWWRSQCGAVMQDGYIFSESIAKNITTSDMNIKVDKLYEACQIANIDEYINTLPLRYNTIIGQDGQGLSQGQKQRILIARAVYKNPSFLFLDEATNALDANNKRKIINELERVYLGKTVVVVAHRLSTVKNADNIVVLDNGVIAEMGTHSELNEKKGLYYNLIKNQLELGN